MPIEDAESLSQCLRAQQEVELVSVRWVSLFQSCMGIRDSHIALRACRAGGGVLQVAMRLNRHLIEVGHRES